MQARTQGQGVVESEVAVPACPAHAPGLWQSSVLGFSGQLLAPPKPQLRVPQGGLAPSGQCDLQLSLIGKSHFLEVFPPCPHPSFVPWLLACQHPCL